RAAAVNHHDTWRSCVYSPRAISITKDIPWVKMRSRKTAVVSGKACGRRLETPPEAGLMNTLISNSVRLSSVM
ncbi:unnamed protein product, partial [Mycena citricolor]